MTIPLYFIRYEYEGTVGYDGPHSSQEAAWSQAALKSNGLETITILVVDSREVGVEEVG